METNNVLLREININKTRTDATIPLKAIGSKKIKRETLLYNLNKIINESDIGYIDYTQDGTNEHELKPLNNLFSDNIVVYSPIPDELIKDIEELKKKCNIEEDKEEEKEEFGEKIPKQVHNVARQILSTTTANIKRVFNNVDIPIAKPDIKPVGIKKTDGFVYKPSTFVQLIKVSLCNISPSTIFEVLEESDKINFLHNNNVYIHDIDFTQDFAGVINKREVIKYITEMRDFAQEENKYDYLLEEEEEEREENMWDRYDGIKIIDNDKFVSNNCLSFLKETYLGTIRYKYYNKFVQSMESPSVRKKVGTHIHDWVNNPETFLKDAIAKSLDTGLLRLEFTVYKYDNNSILRREEIEKEMYFLRDILPTKLIYYNSINNQFNLLCKHVLYNTCILDTNSNKAFISLYQNTLTGKVNGFYLEDVNGTKLSNAIRYYCGNKPIVVIIMQIDDANEEINLQQDVYIRVGKNLQTYISKGSEKLRAIKINKVFNKPEDTGLIPNKTFAFSYPSTSPSLLKSCVNPSILFKQIHFHLLKYEEIKSLRSFNKSIREEIKEEEYMENNVEKIQQIAEKNKEVEKIMEEALLQERLRNKLQELLKNARAYTNKFLDVEDNTNLFVFAFKEVNTRYGLSYLLVCGDKEELTEETELKLFWSTTSITNYISKLLDKGVFNKLDLNNIVAYGSLSGKKLFTVCKEKTYISSSKHICAFVKVKDLNEEEDKEDVKSLLLEEINANAKECSNIDKDVKEGDVVEIIGFRRLKASLLVMVRINEERRTFLASYWLKKIVLERLDGGNRGIFTVIVGTEKTTPQKSKARLYLL